MLDRDERTKLLAQLAATLASNAAPSTAKKEAHMFVEAAYEILATVVQMEDQHEAEEERQTREKFKGRIPIPTADFVDPTES